MSSAEDTNGTWNDVGSTRGERKHLLSVQADEEELEDVGDVVIHRDSRQGSQVNNVLLRDISKLKIHLNTK